MDINDIVKLIQAVSENSLTSFELKEGDTKLTLKRETPQIVSVQGTGIDAAAIAAVSAAVPVQAPAPAAAPAKETAIGSDKVVTSPLVGPFYAAPSPEAEPYVKVGDTVKKGQVLGLIEAMKLMNEIESEYDGVVEAILVENEEVVEYGQPLFRIK